MTLDDFKRITDSESRLWPSHNRVRWSTIFKELGLCHFEFSNEGHYLVNLQRRSLRWVNFNPDGKSCPKDFYVRQESVRFCFWSRQCARIGKIGMHWYESNSLEESESGCEDFEVVVGGDTEVSDEASNDLAATLQTEAEILIVNEEVAAHPAMETGDEEVTEVVGGVMLGSTFAVTTPSSVCSNGSRFAREVEAILQRVEEGGHRGHVSREEQRLLQSLIEVCEMEGSTERSLKMFAEKAGDDAEKRRSGSYRLDGEYETLVLRRGRRAMIDDEAMAKDIEEKAVEEVQALKSAMTALQAAILARAELVQEEDAANAVDDPKKELDDAVQETLRTHGINVQRYWNGAVSYM